MKLWRLPIPPKVHNFWWRVINKFVPTRGVLCDRHIEKLNFCEACGEKETIFHALFRCTWATIFWAEIRSAVGTKIPDLHPDMWAMDMVDDQLVSSTDRYIILCGAWAVWSERNARMHGDVTPG